MAAKPFDPAMKTLVENGPADWTVLLGYPPAPTDVIDADISMVSGAGDKTLLVRAAAPYLLHLEFQSGHDAADLPRKLYARNALLEYRHHLPVHSAAILLRPEADSPQLTGTWQRALADAPAYLTFLYQVVRVWLLPPGPLLRSGPGTLPLATVAAVPEAELPDVIAEMETRLQTRRLRRYAEEVWAATTILLGLRVSQEQVQTLLRGVHAMKESSVYQWMLKEAKAEAEAMVKAEGALAEARKILLRQGRARFGITNARVSAALEQITDVERLEELSERLLQADGWNELLGLPKSRRRSKA